MTFNTSSIIDMIAHFKNVTKLPSDRPGHMWQAEAMAASNHIQYKHGMLPVFESLQSCSYAADFNPLDTNM